MSDFYVGLDLGKQQDYTALIIAERTEAIAYDPAQLRTITEETLIEPARYYMGIETLPARRGRVTRRVLLQDDGNYTDVPEAGEARYDVRYIRRWQLGTSYPAIVADVAALLRTPPLSGNATLIADATGVGIAVLDLLRDAGLQPIAVTITGGDSVSCDGFGWRCPKRDLIAVMQVLLQSRRLRIAPSLPEAATLQSELQTFQTKISATAHDTYDAREGAHDDLVLAAALACWYAERPQPGIRWLD